MRLSPGKKHLEELSEYATGTFRIAFKLAVGGSQEDLIESSMKLIERYGVNAVFGNYLDEGGASTSSGHVLTLPDGTSRDLEGRTELCETIESLVSLAKQ